MEGYLDLADRDRVAGWAWEPGQSEPLRLRVYDNGIPIGEVLADHFREGLAEAGIGDGKHAFALNFPHALARNQRHVIDVRCASDGRRLKDSPRVIECDTSIESDKPVSVSPAQWRGCLDAASRKRVEGWAWDERKPDEPLTILILDNGEIIGRVLANRFRTGLVEAGIGDGRHAFSFTIPGGLSPTIRHIIQVIGEADGGEVPGSPIILDPGHGFDSALQESVSSAVTGLSTAAERDAAVGFLQEQLERVLQSHAEGDSDSEERLLRAQLARRWGRQALSEDMRVQPRALVIDDNFPEVDKDAGSTAILSHMGALQRMGYEVTFAAARTFGLPSSASKALTAEGIHCCCLPYYASVEEVLRRQRDCFDVIYLHRVRNAALYINLARAYGRRTHVVFSVADLHHVRLSRQAIVQARPELATLSVGVRRDEMIAASSAHAVITHSNVEADLLRSLVKGCNVHVVPWVVPPGERPSPWAERSGVAFIGNFAHDPNSDAARLLALGIMPRVLQSKPHFRCLLVGGHMVESVERLAGPGIDVLGYVPDLKIVLSRVCLTVAPLRFGAGVKGKVLESLAAGVPCIMSTIAAEGIPLPDELKALVTDDEERMVALIVRLSENAKEWSVLSARAQSFIAEHYGEANVLAAMQAAIPGAPAAPPRVAESSQPAATEAAS